MEDIFLRQCRESRYQNQGKSDGRGGKFSNPFIGFYEGRTYRQPEVVFISLPQAATSLRFACRARSVGGHFMQTNLRSWIAPFHGDLLMPQEALLRRERTFANILLVLLHCKKWSIKLVIQQSANTSNM